MTTTDETVWGEIQGRTITFPMVVPEANIATLLFTVPAAAASALIPGDAFAVVESSPGSTQLIVAACDYIDNPWGDYREINLAFLARPAGAGDDAPGLRGPNAEAGSFVYRMPVDQAFTCEAGNRVMGFPKTVERITTDYGDDEVVFDLQFGGRPTLRLTIPRVPPAGPPTTIAAVSYSYLDGRPYATTLEMELGSGVVADPATVGIEIGDGPVADELRSLGLPTSPDLATWGEGLSATFHLGQPIT